MCVGRDHARATRANPRFSASWLAGIALVALTALALGACGGDDSDADDDDPAATGTTSTAVATEGGAPSGGSDAPAGAPEPEDPNVPDIYAALEAGASAEADTGEDMNQVDGRVRITLDAIRDDVAPGSAFYVVQPGHRLWVADITIESLGEGAVPLAEWSLSGSDGAEYLPVYGTGTGDDLFYFELTSGQSATAVVAFELPDDVTVRWLKADPSIYVGRNIIFVE